MTGGRLKLSTFFWSSSLGWMSSSGPVEQRGSLARGVAFFSLTWHWTNSLVKHQHTLRNKISRGNGRIHHLKQPLKYNAHVTCQGRNSRNVFTKALRNIHFHCSTGFMKSDVLHLRHSLQKTIYPYKGLEKPKQKSKQQHFINVLHPDINNKTFPLLSYSVTVAVKGREHCIWWAYSTV